MDKSNIALFQHITGFGNDDSAAVQAISEVLAPHMQQLTDRFYAQLSSHPLTNKHIEGRVDALKSTHIKWLNELLVGPHNDEFISNQEIIGVVHVRVKIPPLFVSSSMSFLRHELVHILHDRAENGEITREQFEASSAGILRLLDLCQMLIDNAYEAERLRLLSEATGMKPALIENLINLK
jgi:hypothetical protein